MKILNTIALCLFFSLIIISCGDEEEKSSLEGTWKAQSFDFSAESSFEFGGMVTSSKIDGDATSLDYTLVLDGTNFTTNGGYDLSFTLDAAGMMSTINDSYANVNGSGTYTNTDTEITVNEQFFSFEVSGFPSSAVTGPATASYTIDGDILTISQNETTTETLGTTTIVSTSTWKRQ